MSRVRWEEGQHGESVTLVVLVWGVRFTLRCVDHKFKIHLRDNWQCVDHDPLFRIRIGPVRDQPR